MTDLLPGPDDLFDLAELTPDDFWDKASATITTLATVAGYHTGMHPAVALTVWCGQITSGILNSMGDHTWQVAQVKFADRLAERAYGE